jgi:hypothetical protein
MRGAKRALLRGAAATARAAGALPGMARLLGRTRRLICEAAPR